MLTPNALFGRDIAAVKPVVIFQEGPYGDGLAQVFAQAFVSGGGAALPQTFPFSDVAGLESQVTLIGADPTVDEAFFVSGNISDTVAFYNAIAANIGFDAKNVFVPDAAATPDVLEEANGARFPLTRGSRPAPLDRATDLVYSTFVSAYETLYPDDMVEQFSFTASAYDAAWLVGYGAAWAIENEDGVLNGKNMAKGLRQVSAGDNVQVGPSDWTRALQIIAGGNSFNVEGSSGQLDYSPADEETRSPTEIWTITGTTIVGQYTIAPPL